VGAPQDFEAVTVPDGAGDVVVVDTADIGEDGVRLRAVLGNAEDVPCLLVDGRAGGAV
jgi:hypothetical protein